MKQKLTVTIDSELVSVAEQIAHTRGESLSSLVERSLREVAEEERVSFAERWRGTFHASDRSGARYDALARKYLR